MAMIASGVGSVVTRDVPPSGIAVGIGQRSGFSGDTTTSFRRATMKGPGERMVENVR
jgi:serine acetyltransferase